jgi:glycosyltransferase involved in cell wall biosynthesis
MSRPTVICLTPVKNESWILDRFLKCASLWADHIIIADQHSDDNSREIASAYPKVRLIQNPSQAYSEFERQKLLIDTAREIEGPRLLIALDTDEFLTANFQSSPEWETLLNLAPGTVIRFQRVGIRPDMKTFWYEGGGCDLSLGFMDDGSDHSGQKIHSTRIPLPNQAPTITLRDIKVLHYQYTNWERMESKHRWYLCWEKINQPHRSTIEVYRQYHHMDFVPHRSINEMPDTWLKGYTDTDIDMTSIYGESTYYWDIEVLKLMDKYGADAFKRQAIWNVRWNRMAEKIYPHYSSGKYVDPRGILEKLVHRWLRISQKRPNKLYNKVIHGFLRLLRW